MKKNTSTHLSNSLMNGFCRFDEKSVQLNVPVTIARPSTSQNVVRKELLLHHLRETVQFEFKVFGAKRPDFLAG